MKKDASWADHDKVWEGRIPDTMQPRSMGNIRPDLDISHYDPAPLGADIESVIQNFIWRHSIPPRRVLIPPRYYIRDRVKELGVNIIEVERITKLYVGPRPQYENKRRATSGGRPHGKADSAARAGGSEVEVGRPEDSGSIPESGASVPTTGADSSPIRESQDFELGNGGEQ